MSVTTSASNPIAGQLKPQAIAGAASATQTVYCDASKAPWFIALCAVGAGGGIGSAAFTVVQATDANGTGVKTVTNGPTKTLTVDNTSGTMDIDPRLLDNANGFYFFAVKCSMTGGTNSVATAIVYAADSRYET